MAFVKLSALGIAPGETLRRARPDLADGLGRITGFCPEQPLTKEDLERKFSISDVFLRKGRESLLPFRSSRTILKNGLPPKKATYDLLAHQSDQVESSDGRALDRRNPAAGRIAAPECHPQMSPV